MQLVTRGGKECVGTIGVRNRPKAFRDQGGREAGPKPLRMLRGGMGEDRKGSTLQRTWVSVVRVKDLGTVLE